MCCVFSTLVLFGPRLGILVWWLFWPARIRLVFQGSWIWPLLGLLFLPWTTLMYLAVGPHGVNGLDWLWLGLGLLADMASYSGGAYGNRDRLRG